MDFLSKENARKLRERVLGGKINMLEELYWANIYNSTIADSSWLKNKSVSPGRWAVGYNYLYVLYRVLNDVKPKNIMEMGLGQSTKIITQYAEAFAANHVVLEQNKEWIKFFKEGFSELSNNTAIEYRAIVQQLFAGDNVPVYENLADKLRHEGVKYNLFSIDGPCADGAKFSRIDVLKFLPNYLADDFVMLFDDCGRAVQLATVDIVKAELTKLGIDYEYALYGGYDYKRVAVIASKSWSYLTTL